MATAQGGKVAVDGKTYTVHQVLSGETFYSIALTYNINIDSLRAVNRLTDAAAAIRPGEVLIIPLYAVKQENSAPVSATPTPAPMVTPPTANTTTSTTTTTTTTTTTSNTAYMKHTVVTGETLYSVARLYPHTSVAEIKELNHLETEGLSIGQVLLIPGPKSTPVYTKPIAATNPPVDSHALYTPGTPAVNPNDATVSDNEGSFLASFDMKMLSDFEQKYKTEAAAGNEETLTGTATWISDPGQENQYRFYAMHKTAPIGTIVKVKNLMNNRVVYAKVIGRLANTQANAKVLVRISGGAARYLNVLDDKFMMELSIVKK